MLLGVGTAISATMTAAITRQMGQAYITACAPSWSEKSPRTDEADDVTAEIVKELRRLWHK
jgi:hypothetical protein